MPDPQDAPYFDLGVDGGRISVFPVPAATIEEEQLPDHALALTVNAYRGQTVWLDRNDAEAMMLAIQTHLASLPPIEE